MDRRTKNTAKQLMVIPQHRNIRVIFTVDVEGHVGQDPVNRLIYGITKGGKGRGIDLLMDLLDEFGVKGLFFVDMAEAWDYGEEKVIDVLNHINRRGHNTGVHIHPDHMADPDRRFLHEYSREEQYDIIRKCTELYKEALGKRPEVFRAGGYGADQNTLEILAGLGYKADFSQFYGQKNCHIDPPCASIRPRKLDNGISEIPVTVFRSFSSPFYSRTDKIDASQPFWEYRRVMRDFRNGIYGDIIVMFAHSFSMLDWRSRPDSPRFSSSKYRRLRKQVEYVADAPGYNFTDLEHLLERVLKTNEMNEVSSVAEEVIPAITSPASLTGLIYRTGMVGKSKVDCWIRKLR